MVSLTTPLEMLVAPDLHVGKHWFSHRMVGSPVGARLELHSHQCPNQTDQQQPTVSGGMMALGCYLAAPGQGQWLTGSNLPVQNTKDKQAVKLLTGQRRHQHVAVLDEVLNEPVGSLQLDLMALQPLSEVGTVQEGITELQRRQPHRPAAACRAAGGDG